MADKRLENLLWQQAGGAMDYGSSEYGKEKKREKKGGIHVWDGGLSPPPPPSDMTAPKTNPLKIETGMTMHTWGLIRVRRGRRGEAAVGNMYFGLFIR